MKFISAGHCNVRGPNYDPGAPGVDKRWEANEAVKLRNRVIELIKCKGHKDIISDLDDERLSKYLDRIKTGTGSIVCEFHFNAFNGKATGVEMLVQEDADKMDLACAKELLDTTVSLTGLVSRGVKKESQSQHKRLALMRESGIVVLVEVCFIDNPNDMKAYDKAFEQLCQGYADILIKYDNLIQ